MLTTLLTALLAWTLLFFSLFLARYGVARLEAAAEDVSTTGSLRQGL
jgi:hypothetical protein